MQQPKMAYRIQVSVSEKIKKELEAEARKRGLRVADFVRYLIVQELEEAGRYDERGEE